MRKFEYKCVLVSADTTELEEVLNQWGELGWRVKDIHRQMYKTDIVLEKEIEEQ